jgi:hypothetical protein
MQNIPDYGGADLVVELDLLFSHDFGGGGVDDFGLEVEFFLEADERDHDFCLTLIFFLATSAAASKMARACISVICRGTFLGRFNSLAF